MDKCVKDKVDEEKKKKRIEEIKIHTTYTVGFRVEVEFLGLVNAEGRRTKMDKENKEVFR